MRLVRTIAVSGHRPHHLPRDAARHIGAAVRELADQHPGATWLTGGAVGTDQIAACTQLPCRWAGSDYRLAGGRAPAGSE